jgi:DNA-binding CsgD family transcriptional regulator
MQDVPASLESVARFVDAAALVCAQARALGVRKSVIRLHCEGGPPVLAVESDGEGEPGAGRVEQPLLGDGGWAGTIEHHTAEPISQEQERELMVIGMRLAVWCMVHGIGAIPEGAATTVLGPRQRRIAQLAADGLSNPEIAATLAISINTVKTRLKEVFERLEVESRRELGRVMMRVAPLAEVPAGVTRLAYALVTRAPLEASAYASRTNLGPTAMRGGGAGASHAVTHAVHRIASWPKRAR